MVRMMFIVAGQEYEDVRFEQSEWPSLKAKFPFGQVPALEIDGKMYGQSMAIATYFEKDEAKKSELSKQFKETDAPRFFGFFENMLKENGTGFFVGSDITLADIAVYDALTGMMSMAMGSTENFPMLKAVVDKVGANEKLKEHMAKRPETPF